MALIAIVEDDENIRQELSRFLKGSGYETVCLTKFEHTFEWLSAIDADLILLDVSLPGEDGLSVCGRLREVSDVPVIFVTSRDTAMDELNCILRGGDDYVAKPYQAPILLARIAALLRRTGAMRDTAVTSLTHKGVTLDLAAACILRGELRASLTKNELKILTCLFLNAGSFVGRNELVEYLWDQDIFMDDNALSVNVTRIRARLGEIGAADFIETRRGLGYRI